MNRRENTTLRTWFRNRRLNTFLLATMMLLFMLLAVSEARVDSPGGLADGGAASGALQGISDLGDAPDSEFNHHPGTINTAYFPPEFPVPVPGRFPTVWADTPPDQPSGPRHLDATQFWLGQAVSFEEEADIGLDDDGRNNILVDAAGTVRDIADNDAADDGWLNPDVPLLDCRGSTLEVLVARAQAANYDGPLFLNVWFDGNRDGDWADIKPCDDQGEAFEWIVHNFRFDSNAIRPGGFQHFVIPTLPVMNDDPSLPAWMRFTLSDRPAPTMPNSDLADGRGPPFEDQYGVGETEDYVVAGHAAGQPGLVGIDKLASTQLVRPGDVYSYTVFISHDPNATAPIETEMLDVLPPQVVLVAGPWVTELAPSVNPLFAFFDASIGPNGAVGWHGVLSPGGALRVDYRVEVVHCPDQRLIENEARVLQADGTWTGAGTAVQVDCQLPPADVTLIKLIDRPDDEPTDEWHVLPGQEIPFRLVLSSPGDLAHSVHISDDLPLGLVALHVGASSGVVGIANDGHTVVWDGDLGPDTSPVTIEMVARLTDEVRCDQVLENQALWFTPHLEGVSNRVAIRIACHDLGDAPDSSNHFPGTTMSAYVGVPAEFPTVFDVGPPERGPMHLRPWPLHLGRFVSPEFEADVGLDADGPNNIIPLADQKNLDRGDDGVDPFALNFLHCERKQFPVWVSIDPAAFPALQASDGLAFLNVWLDGNHNGTWADPHQCPQALAPEHIVIDHPVDVAALGPGLHQIWVTTSAPVFWPPDAGAAWLRLTLSERRSNKVSGGGAFGDGRGYDDPFVLGETEDYLLRRDVDPRPDPAVEKDVFVHPIFEDDPAGVRRAWAVGWVVNYENRGAAEAHNVQVVDTYDTGGIPLLEPPHVGSFPPVPHTVSGNTLTFDAGSLLPGQGGHIFIEALLPISAPPGALVTNTVTINADQDADPSNNTAQVVAEIPFLPPWITFPRPGSICTDTFTITGRVQVVATPALMDIDVFVDGTLHQTVHPNSAGVWRSPVSGLSDGMHEIYAQARYMGMTSPPSQVVEILVDSNLFWSPISLHFTDQDGFVLFPRDDTGRMDETGWSVFLRPEHTYTVAVYLCCADPNAQVTLQVGGLTVVLTDPDGDGWYEGTFTTPARLSGIIRLCVTCGLIRHCFDGIVLIDPEGTVYDRQTRQEVEGALVACYQKQTGTGGAGVFDLWPAADFSQVNPQTTAADGYYSFFTPAGTYRVEVTKDGYQRHLSPDLVVVDDPVTYDVYLAPEITEDADYTITIGPLGFDPAVLSAFKGAVVEWVNLDTELHASVSVTPTLEAGGLSSADAWSSGLLAAGESYKLRLGTPGTYTYRDGENGIVTGQIEVAPPVYLPIVLRQ